MPVQPAIHEPNQRPIAARLVTVESQQETDLLTGERSERIFLKLYVEARKSGLLAAISDRDWKTLCTVATYMNQDGFCFPSQDELARALGCTRQTANERIQSLAAFRFQGNPVFCIVPSKRTRKGTWTRNGYRVLPISSLRIYDRTGEKPTVSANPDTVSQPPMSAFTVSANPDTNQNQDKPEKEISKFRNASRESISNDRSRVRTQPLPASQEAEEPALRPEMPPAPQPTRTDPHMTAEEHFQDDQESAAAGPGYANFRRELAQFRATLAEQKRMDADRPSRRRSRDVPHAPESEPQPALRTALSESQPSGPTATVRLRGRPPGTREEREHIGAYVSDIMRELHDQAALHASISRTINLLKQANVPPERWGSLLLEARSITQERSATIDKRITLPSGWDVKNKAPYFFAVLEDLVGLKAQPNRPIPSNRAGIRIEDNSPPFRTHLVPPN